MPDFVCERRLLGDRGLVAGVDEVGRGPLAGPVVAAAVMFPGLEISADLASMIKDSKALTARRREKTGALIRTSGARIGLAACSARVIDRINILEAAMLAMTRAVALLGDIDAVIVDGNRVPAGLEGKGVALVKGDAKSMSVAAASIVAKVARDRLMARLALRYPGYGWEKNAGYGAPKHLEALRAFGPTPHHRLTFAPVRALVM